MKIALINFFFAYNYGAVLQCTALKTVLEKMGHKVDIINYRPYYQMQYYNKYPNPLKSAGVAWEKYDYMPPLKRAVLSAKWSLHTLKDIKDIKNKKMLKKCFGTYIDKNFNLTNLYSTYNELKNNPPQGYDVYVSGSDQLWNPDVTWGVDPAYYLNFGTKNTKRIAYAISPCGLDFDIYSEKIKEVALGLDFISLRESEKQQQLSLLLKRNDIHICPDPTLLLVENDYKKYEDKIDIEKDSYIFFYGFSDRQKDNNIIQYVQKAGKKNNLKILDASLDEFKWNDKENVIKKVLNPGEFLTAIKSAKMIITNSFHGTVFSIIYRKNFMTFTKTGTASRMVELLENLHLKDRIIDNYNDIKDDYTDYTDIEKNLKLYTEKAYDYFSMAGLYRENEI